MRAIPQGYVYTVERFGRHSRTLGPGLGLVIPYVEGIGQKVNVMEQVLDVPSQEAFTRDDARVKIDAVAFYQALDAALASHEVTDLQQALLTLTMTNIRTVVGSMDLDQLLSHRDKIDDRPLEVMDAAASTCGAGVARMEIEDSLPPADLAGAMARQMKAERGKRAAVLEAEDLRRAERRGPDPPRRCLLARGWPGPAGARPRAGGAGRGGGPRRRGGLTREGAATRFAGHA